MTTINQIKTTVVYHANCTDGMMAAFWYYLLYKFSNKLDQVEFIPHRYNYPLPIINGQKVIVVDFSFSKEDLSNPIFADKSVEIYDHHKTSADQFGGYGKYVGTCCGEQGMFKALFVEERSGAGLAMNNVRHLICDKIPQHISSRLAFVSERVEDRDLWNYKLENTRAVYELMNSVPKTFKAWEDILLNISDEEFYKRLTDMRIRTDMRLEMANDYANVATVLPYGVSTFAIVNCDRNFASEVGSILSEVHQFAVMFVVSPKDKVVIASLRSNAQTGVDVSAIVKKFGGGGHVNAASFSFNYEEKPEMFIELLNGKLFKNVSFNFKTEIKTLDDIKKMADFYRDWFSATTTYEVGSHAISGEELTMLGNVSNFVREKLNRSLSIIQIQDLLLNKNFEITEDSFKR